MTSKMQVKQTVRLDVEARVREGVKAEPRTPARKGLKKTLCWLAEPSGRVRGVC